MSDNLPKTPEEAAAYDVVNNNNMNELLQRTANERLHHEGHKSYLNIQEFDASAEEEDARVKKSLGNDELFGQYKLIVDPERKEQRDAFVKIAASDARMSALNDSKLQLQTMVDERIKTDKLVTASEYTGKSEAQIVKSGNFNNQLSSTAREVENSTKLIEGSDKISEEDKKEMVAQLKADSVVANAKLGADSNSVQSEINAQYRRNITARVGKVKEFSKSLWTERMNTLLPFVQSGKYSMREAYADACETTRNMMLYYFKERIAGGEKSDMIHFIDDMIRINKENFDNSMFERDDKGEFVLDAKGNKKPSKTPYGAVDIFDLACLRNSDLDSLKDAAYSALNEDYNRTVQATAREQAGYEQKAIIVKNDARFYAMGVNPETRKGFVNEAERNAAYSKLMARAEQLDKCGYRKSGELILFIKNEPQKEFTRQQRLKQFADKAAAKQFKADSEKEIMNKLLELEMNPNGKYTEEVELLDESGRKRKTKVEMDANRGICTLIEEARILDMCKGGEFTKIYNRHNNFNSNMEMVEKAVNELFKYPLKGTVKESGSGNGSYFTNGSGSWSDRDASYGTYITLSAGSGGTFRASNVGKYNRVISSIRSEKEFWDSDKERYLDQNALDRVIASGKEYLERELENPTQAGLVEYMRTALQKAVQQGDQESFGANYVAQLRNTLEDRYLSKPEIRVNLNPYSSIGSFTYQAEKVGKPDMNRIKNALPLIKKINTDRARNAILLATENDTDDESRSLDSYLGIDDEGANE